MVSLPIPVATMPNETHPITGPALDAYDDAASF